MAEYTIREDYDPDGDLTADADPVPGYLTYRGGCGDRIRGRYGPLA